MIFLIEYDRSCGKLIQLESFADGDATHARTRRLQLELERMNSSVEHEIVILEAASEDQLRKTHRRYFEELGQLANPDSALIALKAA